MDYEFLIVSSITHALKAKSELEGRGIACKVEKLKNVAALGGCGYGVRVLTMLSPAAQQIMRMVNIRILDVVADSCS